MFDNVSSKKEQMGLRFFFIEMKCGTNIPPVRPISSDEMKYETPLEQRFLLRGVS